MQGEQYKTFNVWDGRKANERHIQGQSTYLGILPKVKEYFLAVFITPVLSGIWNAVVALKDRKDSVVSSCI